MFPTAGYQRPTNAVTGLAVSGFRKGGHMTSLWRLVPGLGCLGIGLFLCTAPARAADDKGASPPPASRARAPGDVAADIDRHLNKRLDEAKVPVSPACDDAEFLRRAYLDITGRIPTHEQAAAFLDSTDPDKRAKL